MAFVDVTFLFVFLPLFLAIYFLVPKRARNATLFIASLIFYLWLSPIYLTGLFLMSTFVFVISIPISKRERGYLKQVAFWISIFVNAAVFLLFLYLKIDYVLDSSKIVSPVGVNFILLSCISYLADVYQNRCPRQKNFIDLLVYLLMFPKLLAGPIVKYRDFLGQLKVRKVTSNKVRQGISLFIVGLAKKAVLCDSVWPLYDSIAALNRSSVPFITAWLGAFAAVFVVYFDFSGYIDMARGIGKILGFSLPINFKSPFSALSVADFFKRWNITLLGWFDEYIVGNLKVKNGQRSFLNIGLVAFLYAVFVGQGLGVFVSAAYFTLILIVEELWLKDILFKLKKVYRCPIVFLIISIGAVFYLNKDVVSGFRYVGNMFFLSGQFIDGGSIYYLMSYLFILVLCVFSGNLVFRRYIAVYKRNRPKVYRTVLPIALTLLFIVSICYVVSNPNSSFICMS